MRREENGSEEKKLKKKKKKKKRKDKAVRQDVDQTKNKTKARLRQD